MSASSHADGAAPLTGRVQVPAGARLVLATHNAGKLAELRQILAPLVPGLVPGSIISAASLKAPEPVEDGLSFADNALLKAWARACPRSPTTRVCASTSWAGRRGSSRRA